MIGKSMAPAKAQADRSDGKSGMSVADAAVALGIPEHVAEGIVSRRWGPVTGYFKSRYNEDGYAALLRYGHAVDRLLTVFEELYGHPPFYPTISAETLKTWKKRIAMVAARFGNIAPLVDDMKKARDEGQKPRCIAWFIQAPEGREARWGVLYYRLLEEQEERQKRQELAWRPSGQISEVLATAAHPVTPTWVANARKRLRVIQPYIIGGTATAEMKKDYRELTYNLTRFGYITMEEQEV